MVKFPQNNTPAMFQVPVCFDAPGPYATSLSTEELKGTEELGLLEDQARST